MKRILSVVVAATLFAGCTTSPAPLEGTYFSGFNAQKDGGLWHGGTGLVCPPNLLDMPLTDKHEYGDKGTDASCGYGGGDVVATVYLSELDGSFMDNFRGSVGAVFQGALGTDLEVDEEATLSCKLGGLVMAAASDNQDQTPYSFEAVILRSTNLISLVQMTELDGKFLKLRYTSLDTPPSEGLNACLSGSKALRDVYDLTLAKKRR